MIQLGYLRLKVLGLVTTEARVEQLRYEWNQLGNRSLEDFHFIDIRQTVKIVIEFCLVLCQLGNMNQHFDIYYLWAAELFNLANCLAQDNTIQLVALFTDLTLTKAIISFYNLDLIR